MTPSVPYYNVLIVAPEFDQQVCVGLLVPLDGRWTLAINPNRVSIASMLYQEPEAMREAFQIQIQYLEAEIGRKKATDIVLANSIRLSEEHRCHPDLLLDRLKFLVKSGPRCDK